MTDYQGRWTTVRAEVEDGIGWAFFNRPEKRNSMSPSPRMYMPSTSE